MSKASWVAEAEAFARPCGEAHQGDPALWRHEELVRAFALELAELEGVDPRVVKFAALLHNIGKSVGRAGHHRGATSWPSASWQPPICLRRRRRSSWSACCGTGAPLRRRSSGWR